MNGLSRKHYLLIGLLILIAFVVFVFTYMVMKDSFFGVNEETKAIFSDEDGVVYKDLDGNDISLESYLGRTIVVTSWASWSPFSTADLASLNEFAGQAADDIVFLAINRKESKEQALRFLSTQPEFSNLILVIDPDDRFYSRVGGYAMPETVVFDRKGEIILHDRGMLNIENVRAAVDSSER